jgi:hypothetical protein
MSTSHTVTKAPTAVAAAYETVRLWEAYVDALDEIERLRDFERRYHELLNDSVKRGQEDVANLLRLLMSDRVLLRLRDSLSDSQENSGGR